MIPAPPWHFAGDALWITYRADPDKVATFLPPGLIPGSEPGAAAIGFYDWQWCSADGAELRDPGRAQFRECLIVLDCLLDGQPVGRVPYAWVDSVVPLVRGFIQGMPKLFGSIWLTRSFPVGRAAPRREPGAEFSAVARADGCQIAAATVTLTEPTASTPPLSDRPLVHTRHFPAWQPGEPPLEELVVANTTGIEFADSWQADAVLSFDAAQHPDLSALAPVETGHGYLFSYAETLAPGRRVHPTHTSPRRPPGRRTQASSA